MKRPHNYFSVKPWLSKNLLNKNVNYIRDFRNKYIIYWFSAELEVIRIAGQYANLLKAKFIIKIVSN